MVGHGFRVGYSLPEVWANFPLAESDPSRVIGILMFHVMEQCYCGRDPQVVGIMKCHHCSLLEMLNKAHPEGSLTQEARPVK